MKDPWSDPPISPDPGFDGQWRDLSPLEGDPADPALAEALDFMFGEGNTPVPPYGTPERAVYDWTH